MNRHTPATVLVADDESEYLEAYQSWLTPDYSVVTAHNGHTALSKLDCSIDVALLDRRMPEVSGDDVVREINRRDIDCRVAMITAVQPSVDIIDLPFDDYLVKPITPQRLTGVVSQLCELSSLDRSVQTCYSLVNKKATLEANHPKQDLEANQEYERLVTEIEAARKRISDSIDDLMEQGQAAKAYTNIRP